MARFEHAAAPAAVDEPLARRRQRRVTRAWFAAGYLLDIVVLAVFVSSGAIPGMALLVYALLFGATFAFFLWWSFFDLSPAASMVLDGSTRLVTLVLLLGFAWLYPPIAFYFVGLVVILLCITHIRTRRLSWLRPLLEWGAASAACAVLVAQVGGELAPPFATESERLATSIALAILLARAAGLGFWENGRRRGLAHFKARWRELSERLEDEVSQRTRELERRNAELAEMNRQLRAVAGAVAHDFRQPVITVAGHAGALRHELNSLDARHRAQLDRIASAALHMERICDGMQRLMEVEQAPLKVEPVDVTALARRIARTLGEQAAQHVTVDERLRASADPRLLGIALEVLLSNAWNACADRSDANVRVYGRDGDATRQIFVQDNGVGLRAGEAADLFTPFARLHSDQTYRGSGVSLAVAERIARRHAGTLSAVGSPGEGACFCLALPQDAQETK